MTAFVRKPREAAATAAVHYAFTRYGKAFPADGPVDNAVTSFVRRAIRLIRDRRLPPADLLVEVLSEGEDVRALFVPVAAQWSALTRYHEWPCAWTTSSALETIKRQGRGGDEPWKNEGTWAAECDRAEAERGGVPRHPSRA